MYVLISLIYNIVESKYTHFPSRYMQNKIILEILAVDKQFQTWFEDFGKIEILRYLFQKDIILDEIASQANLYKFETNRCHLQGWKYLKFTSI